jgi:hypothetical protein
LQADPFLAIPLDDRPVTELPKAQTVRLADVFLIGPLMIWGGAKLLTTYPWRGKVLLTAGAATVVYNGYNYARLRKQGYR